MLILEREGDVKWTLLYIHPIPQHPVAHGQPVRESVTAKHCGS
jgi:hypothetical protein